ncbi:MAG: 2-hydroxyacyl-CoA dehydratase family protein [Thermodesulfobacteriota bacterium]|nr:2-hydroxyacyl-CoA dehydratase family protein [Thermodesulfobacteriota bacterium]
MRPEMREYNFDTLLWHVLDVGYRVIDSTEKEIHWIGEYVPYYDRIMDTWANEGKVGRMFLEMVWQYMDNIKTAHEKGKKLGITTFCFSPAIFYALDVVPVMLEPLTVIASLVWDRGTIDYMNYCCEVGFTETACSAQRGALGAYLAGMGEEIDLVVCDTPGVCDTNASAYAFAAAYLKKPFYQIDLPPTLVDERSSEYHRKDFMALIEFLESQTGKKLDVDQLREVLAEYEKQDELIGELEDMQRMVPSPVPSLYNLIIYAGRYFFAGMPVYTRMLEAMVAECGKKAAQGLSGMRYGEEKIRALFCYIDHFTVDFNFWHWLEDNGIAQVGSLLKGFFVPQTPAIKEGYKEAGYVIRTDTMENMIDSLAQINARMPMVNSIRGPYYQPYMWLEATLQVARTVKPDCIIYSGTPGCRNTWGMVRPFMRDIEKHGYPAHIMNSDAFDFRVESWRTTTDRLEEFLKVRGLMK